MKSDALKKAAAGDPATAAKVDPMIAAAASGVATLLILLDVPQLLGYTNERVTAIAAAVAFLLSLFRGWQISRKR